MNYTVKNLFLGALILMSTITKSQNRINASFSMQSNKHSNKIDLIKNENILSEYTLKKPKLMVSNLTDSVYKPCKGVFYNANDTLNDNWDYQFKFDITYNDAALLIKEVDKDSLNNPLYQYLYSYFDWGYLTQTLLQTWVSANNSWINSLRDTSKYDNQHNIIEYASQQYFNSSWNTYSGYQHEYTYDSVGHILSDLKKVWNDSSKFYENTYRYTYTYNNIGFQLTFINEQWQNNQWINFEKYTYFYDNSNFLTTTLIQNWNNNKSLNFKTWENYRQFINVVWNSNFQIKSYTQQDYINGQWVDKYSYGFAYDNNDGYIEIIKQFNSIANTWNNYEQYTLNYDNNKNFTGFKDELWNNNTWKTFDQSVYSYSYDNNNITMIMYQQWDTTKEKLIYQYKYEYSDFVSFTYVKENTSSDNSKLIIYPNPVSDLANVSYNSNLTENINLIITDLTGRKLKSIVTQKSAKGKAVFKLNTSTFDDGIYILVFKSANTIKAQKFVVRK